jgi:hypothetical protein
VPGGKGKRVYLASETAPDPFRERRIVSMRIRPVVLVVLSACLGASAAGLPAGRPAAFVGSAGAATARSRVRQKTGPKIHQATGEVLSISGTSLILLHARGRAKQRMMFVLTPLTKKEGQFIKGQRVIVYYLKGNKKLLAKRVRPASTRHRAHKSSTTKSKR